RAQLTRDASEAWIGSELRVVEIEARFHQCPPEVETVTAPLGLAQPRPHEAVKCHESEAKRRHDEAAREIVTIGDRAHYFRQYGAAHDGHDDERRRFLCGLTQTKNPERENCGEHDRHEEVGQEDAGY